MNNEQYNLILCALAKIDRKVEDIYSDVSEIKVYNNLSIEKSIKEEKDFAEDFDL